MENFRGLWGWWTPLNHYEFRQYAYREPGESVESLIRRVSGLKGGDWRFPELTEYQIGRVSRALEAGKSPTVKVGGMARHYSLDRG